MMHTRSKTRAQLDPNQTSPDTQQQYQIDKVISDTVSSPMIASQEGKGGPFSSPFRRPQSFMRNVLARVSNSTAAESISAPHTAPALIEQSKSSPLDTVTTTSDLRPTIKQEQDPSPRKPSPTKEDLLASNQPNLGPTASISTAASPKEKNLVAGSTPNASKTLF